MKNIFRTIVSFLFGAMALAACQHEVAPLGTEISVDPSAISVEGIDAADQTVTVTADGDWIAVAPQWIKVAPQYGSGNTTVTLSFSDNLDADNTLSAERTAKVLFSVAEKSAELTVTQEGDPEKAPAEIKQITIAEFLALPQGDPTVYQLAGTVEKISNTQYGNFYLTDETGTVYVYGLLDADRESKKFETLGIDNGDFLVCQSSINEYNGNPQAKNAVYVRHEKSLISIVKAAPSGAIPYTGGEATITLTCKGADFEVVVPEEATWLTVSSKLQSGELAVVELTAAPNEDAKRTVDVEFVTLYGGKEYKATATVEQQAKPVEPTVTLAQIRSYEDGADVTARGTVMAVHGQGAIIADQTALLYVYTAGAPDFAVGNTIVVTGSFKNYYGTLQIESVDVVSNDGATAAPEYPTAEERTQETLVMYGLDQPTDYPYVKVRGVLDANNYGAYVMVGEAKVVLYKSKADYSALKGKTVEVVGYMMGYNSKFSEHQLIELSVKEVEAQQ